MSIEKNILTSISSSDVIKKVLTKCNVFKKMLMFLQDVLYITYIKWCSVEKSTRIFLKGSFG